MFEGAFELGRQSVAETLADDIEARSETPTDPDRTGRTRDREILPRRSEFDLPPMLDFANVRFSSVSRANLATVMPRARRTSTLSIRRPSRLDPGIVRRSYDLRRPSFRTNSSWNADCEWPTHDVVLRVGMGDLPVRRFGEPTHAPALVPSRSANAYRIHMLLRGLGRSVPGSSSPRGVSTTNGVTLRVVP